MRYSTAVAIAQAAFQNSFIFAIANRDRLLDSGLAAAAEPAALDVASAQSLGALLTGMPITSADVEQALATCGRADTQAIYLIVTRSTGSRGGAVGMPGAEREDASRVTTRGAGRHPAEE